MTLWFSLTQPVDYFLEPNSQKQSLAHLSTFGIATQYAGAQADRQAAQKTR